MPDADGNNNESLTQKKGNNFFDVEDIQNLTKMPLKRSDISNLLDKYESEAEFIDSLNLRDVIINVFKTLEKSLVKI
jgi:hypothetical protein